jgi:hypothetical protein
VHDITELETLGTPGAFVASSEFETAAAAQSRSLGFQPAAVFVPHPIQDRTDGELHVLADEALEPILEAILARED